jgi:hypothetical protein
VCFALRARPDGRKMTTMLAKTSSSKPRYAEDGFEHD